MSTKVFVRKGMWRDKEISKMEFDMVSDGVMTGRKGPYITVDGKPVNSNTSTIRIYIDSERDIDFKEKEVYNSSTEEDDDTDYPAIEETDQEVMDRINDRFVVLDEMTEACSSGLIKSLIVEGSAGAGKSYTVEQTLDHAKFHNMIGGDVEPFEIIKGTISPIGLYKKLYEYKEEGQTLVFDDCDSVFYDQTALSLLKAALDTTPKRKISWNTNSLDLSENGIPNTFEFKGAVIFITNFDMENTKSKQLKPHFEALMSRSHYLNLTISTNRDKFLRIKGLIQSGEFLEKYRFSDDLENEILEFIENNINRLRELSLRTTIKIADIAKMKPSDWKRICAMTVCK